MGRAFLLIVSVSALFVVSSPSHSEQLTNLFNTGVDDSGGLLSNTVVDPHYALISSPDISYPGPDAHVVDPAPPWVVNGPASKWLSPSPDGGSAFRAVGNYTYRTQFDLTGYDPCTCVVTGNWASDDETVDIYINGLATSNTLSGLSTFDILHPLTITNGFVSGTNAIDILIHNGGFQTGIRAEFFGFASVGEGAHLRITKVEASAGDALVSFTTCTNHIYRVDRRDDFISDSWATLTNGIAGTGDIVTVADPGAAAALPKRFYRAVLVLP
ncbi:MAG TPA: hypothetical protein VLZ12_12540 [Verrucomicrobiae bacterium]|nr:hypothetical protein [Verrucomicrobiae bacterium]